MTTVLYSNREIGELCGAAATILETDGHAKHVWQGPEEDDGKCPKCPLAAINVARGAEPSALVPKEILNAIHAHLFPHSLRYRAHFLAMFEPKKETDVQHGNVIIWSWNDLDETTTAEVLGVLRRVEASFTEPTLTVEDILAAAPAESALTNEPGGDTAPQEQMVPGEALLTV